MIDLKLGSKGVVLVRLLVGLAVVLAALPNPPAAHATGTICYVDDSATAPGTGASWATAYTDLQSALTNLSCDEVWVKPGVYRPTTFTTTDDRAISFVVRPGVAVYGGFAGTETQPSGRLFNAGPSILSGDIDNNDLNADGNAIDENHSDIEGTNSYHVVMMDGTTTAVDGGTILDGFTITGGQADSASEPTQWSGGGLYCNGSGATHNCSPALLNLVFSGNSSSEWGGGLFNNGDSGTSSPTLTNVVFMGNSASNGGGLYNNGPGGVSSPTLTNVSFLGNAASLGAGTYNNGSAGGISSPKLTRVSFSSNVAAGGLGAAVVNDAFDGGTSNAEFYDVTFSGNQAGKGGAVYDAVSGGGTNSPVFSRALFDGNQASQSAGAVYLFAGGSGSVSNPKFANVTFSGNHGSTESGDGGAVSMETSGGASSQPTFTNTTFYGNYAYIGGALSAQNDISSTGQPTIVNSILWGNTDIAGHPEINRNTSTPTISYSVVQGSGGSGGSWDATTLGIDGGHNLATDPKLGALADNGGPTKTIALLGGSSAIDAGNNNACAAAPVNNRDARGFRRPADGNGDGTIVCDIGAYEYGAILQLFADVPVPGKEWMESWIVAFYRAGITTGCGMFPDGLHFCPEANVSRAEMAVFLLRARHGAGYQPPLANGYFSDMPVAGKEWMERWVDQYYREGLTTGCGMFGDGLHFCPEANVTRAEMAVFILRATHGAGYVPPASTGVFSDVPVTGKEWMQPWIEQFYREGITTGCGGGMYCPENNVTRAEMAVFIGRAYHLYP